MKTCTVCARTLTLESFVKDNRAKTGRGGRCYECFNKVAMAKYHADPVASSERMRRWYKNNKDVAHAKNAEYYRANKPAMNANRSKKRAARRKATPPWANHSEILKFYELAARLTIETGFSYHVDHIVPITSPLVCGLHWEGNLQVLRGDANMRKGNRVWPDMP